MSSINRLTNPFYEKHHLILKTIWNIDKTNVKSDEKLSKLKQVIESTNPNELFDIYDEQTGESRAKVTPLILACFEGDFDTIEYLINLSVNPNEKESEHNLTAIHILVDGPYQGQTIDEKQRAQLLNLLIEKGANVDLADKHQMAPIHKVVINDRSQCLDVLIQRHVDPNQVFMGETPLSIAARQNRDHILQKLLQYSSIKSDVKSATGGNLLHFAAAGMIDSPKCVDLLLKAGVLINEQDKRGNSPVMVACFFNKAIIVERFVDGKADLTIRNNEGKDAHDICVDRDADECRIIIEKNK